MFQALLRMSRWCARHALTTILVHALLALLLVVATVRPLLLEAQEWADAAGIAASDLFAETTPSATRDRVVDHLVLRLFNNSPLNAVGSGFAERAWYLRMQREWGDPDELFLIDMRPPPGLSETEQLARVTAVQRALSAAPAPYLGMDRLWWAGAADGVPMEELSVAEHPDFARALAALRNDPALPAYWSPGESPAWAIYAFVDPAVGDSDLARLRMEGHLASVLHDTLGVDAIENTPSPDGWHAIVAGTGSATGQMLLAVREVVTTDFAIVNTVILVLCLLIFRNPVAVGATVTAILQSAVLSILPMLAWRGPAPDLRSAAGSPFDWITANMSSGVFLMGIAGSLHLLHTYLMRRRAGDTATEAIEGAVETEIRPYFYAVLTTAMSMVALSETSSVASVVRYGRFSAIGLMFSVLTSITLLPALLVQFHRGDVAPYGATILHVARAISSWSFRRPVLVLSTAAAVSALGVASVVLVTRFDGEIVSYFRAGAPGKISERAATAGERWGIVPWFLELRLSKGSWFDGDKLAGLRDLDRELSVGSDRMEAPKAVLSLGDAAASACAAAPSSCTNGLPATVDVARWLIPNTTLYGLVTPPAEPDPPAVTRIVVLSEPFWAREGPKMEAAATASALRYLPFLFAADGTPSCLGDAPRPTPTWANTGILELIRPRSFPCLPSVRMSGMIKLWFELEHEILQGYVRSLVLSVVPNLLVLAFVFRDRVFLGLSLLPNLTPIFVALGFLGWFTEAIPTPAAFGVCIATGVVADDTTFFLTHLRDRLRHGDSVQEALSAVLSEACIPIVAGNLALVFGFATLGLSDLRPIAWLGWVLSATIFVAMFCDLLLLPAALGALSSSRSLRP